jgi:hypothetical protein
MDFYRLTKHMLTQKSDELPVRVFLTINHEEFEEDSSQADPIPATPDSLLARPRIKLYSGKQMND